MTIRTWSTSLLARNYRLTNARLVRLAVEFYLVHVSCLVLGGSPAGPLWFCHVGCLMIATGLWLGRPRPAAVGL